MAAAAPSGLLIFFKILSFNLRLHKFLSYAQHFLQTIFSILCSAKRKFWNSTKPTPPLTNQQQCLFGFRDEDENHIDDIDDKLCRAELKMVMEKLGMERDDPGDHLVGARGISALFDEEEPSLEEVREAFGVFDENKDGFIDSTELQRVLWSLGFGEEVSEVEECKRMIDAFDRDGDGLIDLPEFVGFMEKCLC